MLGAGAVGGCLGGYLAYKGENVTFIARGKHLDAIRENGLRIIDSPFGDICIKDAKAMTCAEYQDKADVIFVCVKDYSLGDLYPFIERAAHENTFILPVLNGLDVGEHIAEHVHTGIVLGGAIYISAFIREPGVIANIAGNTGGLLMGELSGGCMHSAELENLAETIRNAGVKVEISDNIGQDIFRKFMCVSAISATNCFFNTPMGEIRHPGPQRALIACCIRELLNIADMKGYVYEEDQTADIMSRVDNMEYGATTSMQRDWAAGRECEIDAQIYEPVRIGEKMGLYMPAYRLVSEKLGFKG